MVCVSSAWTCSGRRFFAISIASRRHCASCSGFRIRRRVEHRVVQRPVDALAVQHAVDVIVALEQLHVRDARQRAIHLLGVPAPTPSMQKMRTFS